MPAFSAFLRLAALGLTAALTTASACRNDKSPAPALPVLSFKVDGASLGDLNPNGAYYPTQRLFVTSGDTVGNDVWNVYLAVDSITRPGNVTTGKLTYVTYDGRTIKSWADTVSGTVRISLVELDLATNRVSGSFSGTLTAEPTTAATGTRVITQGQFTHLKLRR